MCCKISLFKFSIFIFSIFIFKLGISQPAEKYNSREQYIKKYSSEAVNQMVQYKIPASITLAQGILESNNGNSELAKYGNNHFGIKCHKWEGEGIYQDDDAKNECFRKYSSALESFKDHSLFLSKRGRYSFLFNLKLEDYKGWAKGLKKAGYATNPQYANILISLIEKHELYQFDKSSILAKNIPTQKQNTKHDLMLKKQNKHSVSIHQNNIKYITAKSGDTFYSLANEFEMGLWQIYKYNNLDKGDILKINDIIFLQPKRNRCNVKFHVVKNGDNIKSISQFYGLKLKKILKRNDMSIEDSLLIGSKVYLRKSKK